jgi:hypothetical protein
MTNQDLEIAYRHAVRHRVELQQSEACACFNCFARFAPSEVKSWIDTGQTALCPECSMDAVIGSASGIDLDYDFLERMKKRWFPTQMTA